MLAQNEEIDRLQLPRIENDEELAALESRQELVPIEESLSLRVAPNLQPSRRYCKPWTRDFLDDLGEAYYEEFHQPIQVNSAVRTAEQQHKLRRHNRNAAPEEGETASSHLAGLTVDIAKRGLTRKQHQWLGEYFLNLKNQGLIEGAEERRQACFHIMVSEKYAEWRALAREQDAKGVEESPGSTELLTSKSLPAVAPTTAPAAPVQAIPLSAVGPITPSQPEQ